MAEPTLSAHIRSGGAAHDGCPLVFASADGEREGIDRGDVVAVQLPGSYEGAVIQVAVALCGAVLLPVVMIYGPREMDFVLRRSGAAAVVLPRVHRGRPRADAVLGGLSGLPMLTFAVVVGDDAPGHGGVGYADLLRQPGGTYREPSPDPGDRAVLMYTSGTTADPKGVQHSHRTLLAEATSPVYSLNGPGARHLGLFPPGHMAGLLSLLRILLLGTPTVIMQAWDAALAPELRSTKSISRGP
jgi:cyclohexanecarboxylate-CoA ligase